MYDDIPEGFSVVPGFSGYPAQDTPEFPTYRDYPPDPDKVSQKGMTELPGYALERPHVFLGRTVSDVTGLVQPGNIDLTDPRTSTRDTFHIEDGGMRVVLPRVWGGVQIDEPTATRLYKTTGRNLGMFKDEESADDYTRHLAQWDEASKPKPYGLDILGKSKEELKPKTLGRQSMADVLKDWAGIDESRPIPSQEEMKQPKFQVGMATPGNIDLDNLTPVELPTGDADTLLPIAVTDPKKKQSVLIPTVIDGRIFSPSAAIRDYQKTGKHLGIFKDNIAAEEYKRKLQDRQNQFYGLASNIPTQMADPTDTGTGGGRPELAPSYLTGIPPEPGSRQAAATANRQLLIDAIDTTEKAGYKVPHGIGTPNEPEGDRGPTRDMENLVTALGKMQQDTKDPKKASGIAQQRAFWEEKIRNEGMSQGAEDAAQLPFNTQPPQPDVPDVQSNRFLLASTARGIPIAPPSQEESDRQIRAEQLDKQPEIRKAEPGQGQQYSDIPEGFSVVNGGNGKTYSDIPEGFSVSPPSWREDIMKQLDEDPATKKLAMQMLDTEGGGKATMEALVNRTAMIRQKIPDWTLKDELNSGFYGPINRGYAQTLNLHPGTIEKYQQDIDAVRAGSNVIAGRTDQGYRGDPNSQGPGRVIPPGSSRDEVYNYWVGKRRGVDFSHADAAAFADQVLSGGPKFGSTAQDWAQQEIARQRSAQYSDIPEGFSVLPDQAPQYSDIPEGFSVLPDQAPPQEKAPPAPIDLPVTPPPSAPPIPAPLKDIVYPQPAVDKMLAADKPRREVGFGESFSRENAREILGMGEALNRMVISPALQGVSEAAKKIAPDSAFAKLTDKANRDWQTTMVDATSAMRKSLEIDPNTEKQTLTGEAGGMIGNLFPQLVGAAVTPGVIATKFLLPAVTEGMDAMKRAKEKGANPAQQIGAFAWGLASTEAFVNLPLHVQSAAAGPIMRFVERTMKGTLVAGGAHEGLRDINNLITPFTGGQQQPFSLKELAKVALPMGVFGGVMGENARPQPQGPIAEQAFPKVKPEPAPMPGGEEKFAPGAPPEAPAKPAAKPAPEFAPGDIRMAIRVKGEVFDGAHHYEAIKKALGKYSREEVAKGESGSITDDGKFEPYSHLGGIKEAIVKDAEDELRSEAAPPTGGERFAPGAPKGEPYQPVPEEAGAGVGLVASPETAKAAAEVKEIGKEIKAKSGLSPTSPFVRMVNGWGARKVRAAQKIETMRKELDAHWKDLKLNAKQIKVRNQGVTNYLQAGGDRATMQHWFDNTTDRELKAGYQAALNLSPREVAAAGAVRQIFNDYLVKLRAAGVDVKEFKDYVTGMWQARLAEKSGMGIPRTMSDYFRFKKQKFFENYFAGEKEGYKPLTKDIRELLAFYMQAAEKTMNDRQLLKDMDSGTINGEPMLSTVGSGASVEGPKGAATLVFPKGALKETADGRRYKALDFPALRNWKWVAGDSAGNPVLLQGDVAVHPDIATHLEQIFGQSKLDKWLGTPSNSRLAAYSKGISRLLLKDVQSYYKGTLFAGIPSGFHAVHQAGEMGLGFQINPFRGIEKPDLQGNPEHMDMANHGLMLGSDHVSQELFNEGVGGGQKNLVTLGLRQLAKVKGLGYAENVARTIDDVSKWLFQHYIPGLGIKAYRAALPRNMKRFAKELEAGTLSESDIKDLTADQVNASTGHQNMEASAIWSNKDVQQAMSTFLIAPHFTLGRVTKVFHAATSGFGIARKGREQAIGLGITAATLYLASRVLNLITDGDPHFEARRLFQVKVGDRWVGMRSIPGDIQRMLGEGAGGIGSGPSLYNKTTPAVHLATHWLTGRDERGRPFSFGGELHDLLLGAAPMPIQGLTNKFTSRGAADPLGPWDHLAGAMGFPVQKYNPTSEVYYDARAWQKKNTPGSVNTLQLPPSKYINLEFALEENDPTRIREEIANLKAQGMTADDIFKNYAERIDHPYARSQENDKKFSQSVFADRNKMKESRDRKVALIGRLQLRLGPELKKQPVTRDADYFIKRGQ